MRPAAPVARAQLITLVTLALVACDSGSPTRVELDPSGVSCNLELRALPSLPAS